MITNIHIVGALFTSPIAYSTMWVQITWLQTTETKRMWFWGIQSSLKYTATSTRVCSTAEKTDRKRHQIELGDDSAGKALQICNKVHEDIKIYNDREFPGILRYRDQFFPIPVPVLFSGTIFFRYRYRYHPKKGKILGTGTKPVPYGTFLSA